MFSKPLFKQSCKANGTMWIIITVAVCFMLSCMMLISGSGNISSIKVTIEDTTIKEQLNSTVQSRAINYYEIADEALEHFDKTYSESYPSAYESVTEQAKQAIREQVVKAAADQAGIPEANREAFAEQIKAQIDAAVEEQLAGMAEQLQQGAMLTAYASAATELTDYTAAMAAARGYEAGSDEAVEIQGVVFYVLNPLQEDGSHKFDSFYTDLGEEAPHYETLLPTIADSGHEETRRDYAMHACSYFLAGNLVKEDTIQTMMDKLTSYGITRQKYADFGFDDYDTVQDIACNAVVDYRADLGYRLENMKDGETTESVKADVLASTTKSMISSLPDEIVDALSDIGQEDMYGIMIGAIFFKMAGLLLPIIYMIMAANALIAGQVDSGSMAYVLSTSVKRKSVVFTQALYLVLSLLVMFMFTAATSMVCLSIADVDTELNNNKLLLINLGAFLVMFAMSGISFFASCVFNRSKNSMGFGGGINMFFLVATMLGLFGSSIIPSIVRMDALNAFNYVSVISLFDVISILGGTTAYIWKFAILVAIGLAFYIAGSVRFVKKDLPL